MTIAEKRKKYVELCHAMQTGVAYEMNVDADVSAITPKHLRVGVNSALVNSEALAKILLAKGIMTEDEYWDALIAAMQDEVIRYTKRLEEKYGIKVTLV